MSGIRFTPSGDRRVTVDAFIRIIAPRLVPSLIRAAPVYSVDLCTGFSKVGEADAFTFDGVIRNLATGEWRLNAPLVGVSCPDVDAVDSIIVWDQTQPARIVFAGRVARVGGVDACRIRILNDVDDAIEWVGVDIYGLLAQRQVWPTPATEPPWADAYDERTGVGSTVAAEFISANMGVDALPDRQVAGLQINDAGVGTSSTWSGRLQPLDEFIGRICRESGITCSARMPEPGVFRFILKAPADLSNRIVISDQGDLEDLSRLVTPGEATFVLGAGQGELTARDFRTASSSQTGLDRVEVVYENTNISTVGGLQKAVDTELVLRGTDVSIDGKVAESAAQQIRWIDDYDIGDYLGVEVDGTRYSAQVEAVTFTLSPERDIIRPVLGRAAGNSLKGLLNDVSDLQSRFDTQIA